jgi:hypothetical protein
MVRGIENGLVSPSPAVGLGETANYEVLKNGRFLPARLPGWEKPRGTRYQKLVGFCQLICRWFIMKKKEIGGDNR